MAAMFGTRISPFMKRGDLGRQLVDDRRGELATLCDPIQPRLLIEARHLQQPFHGFTGAGQRQRAAVFRGSPARGADRASAPSAG